MAGKRIASDPEALTRTWQIVMDEMGKCKHGSTKERWARGMAEKPFDLIRNRPLIESRPEHFLEVLNTGTVSTNIFLRPLHNFALDMNWLLAPIIPRRKCTFSWLVAEDEAARIRSRFLSKCEPPPGTGHRLDATS
jgi:hypothetical protein